MTGANDQPTSANQDDGADPTVDDTVRPPLVADALAHRGLVEPEGVNAETAEDDEVDVVSGGRPGGAPRTDRNAWKQDDELVGAGPQTHAQLNHVDDVEDATEE